GALESGLMHGTQNRLMLDRRGEDGVATCTLAMLEPPGTENGDVVSLGASGGEANLVGGCAKTSADSLAGLGQCRARLTPPTMHAGWVAEARPKKGQHGLEDLRLYGRRRRVV